MRKLLLAGLSALILLGSSAKAEFDELPLECPAAPDTLRCRVLDDLKIDMSIYLGRVGEAETLRATSLLPMFLLPRFVVANGDLARGVELIDEIRETYPDTWEWTLYREPDPFRDLRHYSRAIAADFLPVMDLSKIPDTSQLAAEGAGDWAIMATARALAAAGEAKHARGAFMMIAEAKLYRRAHLYIPWAAAGFADDALASITDLRLVPQARAELNIADGLAQRGDVEGVAAIVSELPGGMPILGQAALAEAYRRAGDPEMALAILDDTARSIETAHVGARDEDGYRRLAIGYALLGDIEMTEYMMLRVVHHPIYDHRQWEAVAPAMACHDFDLAMDVISKSRGDDDLPPDRDVKATVEVLLAAAASGNGEAAYAFADSEDRLLERTVYLMAVSIGLIQADAVSEDAAPCATLNVVPR